jgi:hypothetical protein
VPKFDQWNLQYEAKPSFLERQSNGEKSYVAIISQELPTDDFTSERKYSTNLLGQARNQRESRESKLKKLSENLGFDGSKKGLYLESPSYATTLKLEQQSYLLTSGASGSFVQITPSTQLLKKVENNIGVIDFCQNESLEPLRQ